MQKQVSLESFDKCCLFAIKLDIFCFGKSPSGNVTAYQCQMSKLQKKSILRMSELRMGFLSDFAIIYVRYARRAWTRRSIRKKDKKEKLGRKRFCKEQ